MNDWLMDIFLKFIIIFSIGFLFLFGWCVFQDSKKPTFSLKKEDWTCTEYHYETQTTYIYVNKVMIPQITTHSVCDNYKRIK